MLMFGPLAPSFGTGGASILNPIAFTGGGPIGPGSLFNIGGAPIALLGGVFSNGLPLAGPVGQVFRGSGPQPNTLSLSTLSPAGPIGNFLLGRAGGSLAFGPTEIYLSLPGAAIQAPPPIPGVPAIF